MTTSTDARVPVHSAPEAPSQGQSTWLVAEREIRARLRSKSFIISTAILLLLVLASIIIGGFVSQRESTTPVGSSGP